MVNEIQKREYLLKPGYLIVALKPTIVYSVVGSSVLVCIYDKGIGVGACSNYLYPYTDSDPRVVYGNIAIPVLIKMMVEEGATIETMEAQLFGGGDRKGYDIGRKNVDIALKILDKQGIRVVSQDTGGEKGRKVIYHTWENTFIVAKVNRIRETDWYPYGSRE